jgi:poly(A) polymerase
LVQREKAAGVAPEPLRRLAALLPAEPQLAEAMATRLRLSNKAVKRLASAAAREGATADNPLVLAYAVGRDEAVDRLLLGDGNAQEVAEKITRLSDWTRPRFPMGGGDLIEMGVAPGPLVARTLQAIERDWVESGFPEDREKVRALARARVDQALRDSQ